MKATSWAACLLVSCLPSVAGDITGHVVVTKRLTKQTLKPADYSLRGAPNPAPVFTAASSNEFDRMVVMLEGTKTKLSAPETVVIEQRNGKFDPELVVVPPGSTVKFPNEDPIFHNVFSLSRAKSFDLGFYPLGQSRAVKFDREGIVQVYCHIHASMYAGVVVTANPYTRPSADGSFSWTNLPAGRYRAVVWHKVAGRYTAEVVVPESGKTEVTIRVPVDAEP
jgi:plastocyanin